MTVLALMLCLGAPGNTEIVGWSFDTDADVKAWVANGHLKSVTAKDGIVSADAVDWDPFFTCRGVEFPAAAHQMILLRIKADKPGQGQIFWSGETSGTHGGLSPQKVTSFQLEGKGAWEDVVVLPFWQREGVIRQLRLDVYEGAHFDIDSIRVVRWGSDAPPKTDVFSWRVGDDASVFRVHPASDLLLASGLRISVIDKGWASVRIKSERDATANVVWATADAHGLQSQAVKLRGDGKLRIYDVELAGIKAWKDPVVAFGVRPPAGANARVESFEITIEPKGPAEIAVNYFGFENGVQRAGRPGRVIAYFVNRGGSAASGFAAKLSLPAGLKCVDGSLERTVQPLEYHDQEAQAWRVVADAPGDYTIRLTAAGKGAPTPTDATLRVMPSLKLAKADYVPPPKPVETTMDVCAYYFPGWHADSRWECIRRVAPIRKPVLGYYDESNPECVDWQIKWAVENGITCFLVDWYWIKGNKSLEHWFDAYRKAKYRDMLKVAIMWANHIPPGSHSLEDWRKVTREWIEKYFTLKAYYHIEGKPAVFLWSPHNIRRDLGGLEKVTGAFAESQQMARDAGHQGISFLAMFGHESAEGVKTLAAEGYYGATNYHEWAEAQARSKDPKHARYDDVVATVRKTWASKVARCGKLVYYPVVDTGWDSRPWHGDRAFVLSGRTPKGFEDILRQARDYCTQIGRKFVVLGPVNEWGEGSYIEPNTEFGFEMLEAIRRVFAKGEPAGWPVNVTPADVGRGPYDYPVSDRANAWSFTSSTGGWSRMMGVSQPAVKDGALRFKTLTNDPAITVGTGGFRAKDFKRAVIRMQIVGKIGEGDGGQVFFAIHGQAMTEPTSFRFPLATDGEMHTYTVDLTQVPRWRSRITTLRFDPCSTKDVEVVVDEMRLE